MKNVAIIGTQGVPAKYGGFETLVENIIGDNCSDDIRYTVFCSSKDLPDGPKEYKGARLKYVPLRANGAQSIPYDIISMMRCMRGYDAVLVLGVSGCIFLPVFKLLCRKKLIVNIDGLEYRRTKWKNWVRKYLKMSEKLAVRFADIVITDNKGIQDYARKEYNVETTLIAYGGNHALVDISRKKEKSILEQYGLTEHGFSMSLQLSKLLPLALLMTSQSKSIIIAIREVCFSSTLSATWYLGIFLHSLSGVSQKQVLILYK